MGLLSPDVRVDSLGSVLEGIDGAFKAFVEYEGTEVGSTSSYFVPFIQGTPGKTVIADPESRDVNRAWLQYAGYESRARYGLIPEIVVLPTRTNSIRNAICTNAHSQKIKVIIS